VSQLLVAQRALTVPGWAKDALWRRAQAIPSLVLRFSDNKSLVDAVTGASLVTFTRASSGTFVGSDGVLQTAATDVPRFNHNPTTGESLGLLVEEQRTNLLLNSGTLSTQSVTVAAVAHTLSFTGTGTITLTGVSTAGPLVGTGTGEANRVSLTFTPTAGSLTLTVSGTVTNAQLEAGAFRTSYIATTGSAATRSADVASITGSAFSNWYRQDEGTVFADINTAPVANIAQAVFDLSEGAGLERIFQRRNTGGFVVTAITDNNVVQGDFGSVSVSASGRARSGLAYRLNDFEAAVNGSASGTDTSATVPTPDRIHMGQNFASGQAINGTIRRLCYWPTRLPSSTLPAVTQ
jgi:hypothetical protein